MVLPNIYACFIYMQTVIMFIYVDIDILHFLITGTQIYKSFDKNILSLFVVQFFALDLFKLKFKRKQKQFSKFLTMFFLKKVL